MTDVVLGLLSFLIAASAFVFGVRKLFRKKKPLYLQLLVCAAGCFALQQLSGITLLWCGAASKTVSIGMLGIFGCNFFLLSANYGTLDRVVDDGGAENKRARRMALTAPVIAAVLMAAVFAAWRSRDLFCAIVWLFMFVPALPASYFNLKHILLPIDDFEILKATRLCNVAALCFYVVTAAYIVCTAFEGAVLGGIASIAMSLSASGLVFAAVRGAEKWGI